MLTPTSSVAAVQASATSATLAVAARLLGADGWVVSAGVVAAADTGGLVLPAASSVVTVYVAVVWGGAAVSA